MDADDIIFTKRYSIVAHNNNDRDDIMSNREIKVEYVNLMGSRKKVFRMYERHNASFGGVGWIVNDDIDCCMVCGKEFYFFRRRHHCRSCGNLVCDSCSPHYVCVEELKDLGDVRVCVQCYWGQYPVYAARERVDSDSDDDSDASDDSLSMAMRTGKINAALNASTKTVSVEVEDFLEYCELVVLEVGQNWAQICSTIWSGLHMPVHLEGEFEYFVIVDEDGDEISSYITDGASFWQHADELTVTNNNKLLACVAPVLKEQLYQHRKNLLLEMKSPSKGKTTSIQGAFSSVDEISDEVNNNATASGRSRAESGTSTGSVTETGAEGVVVGMEEEKRKKRAQKRRSSISIADEALISSSGVTVVQDDHVSGHTDVEDTVDEVVVDFNSVDLIAHGGGTGASIVDVNPKNHTVVVQLKSGKNNTMSRTDSESLVLARRAIADSMNHTSAVSSPAQLSVIEGKKKWENTTSNINGNNDTDSGGTDFHNVEKTPEKQTPRLINKFQKELKSAFDELSVKSREEDPTIDNSLLSLTTFLKWSEVVRAVSEISGLDTTVIEEEFVTIASDANISCNKFHTPLINLEGFCILMERLETLGERRSLVLEEERRSNRNIASELDNSPGHSPNRRMSVSRRYSVSNIDLTSESNLQGSGAGAHSNSGASDDEVVVPEELVEVYKSLLVAEEGAHKAGKKKGKDTEGGLSSSAILQWDNIQEALAQEILLAEDIERLCEQTIADSGGEQGTEAHRRRLTLKEFYLFAVKLQMFVDEKCGAW